jgi:DNA helicase-2/ATP-dependent DNA helicase PcrA
LLDAIAEVTDPQEVMERFSPPAVASAEWKLFVDAYRQLRSPNISWPADLESAKAWYVPIMERLYDDAHIRMNDIEQLIRLAAGYASREQFLAELTLDPPAATSDESGPPLLDEDYLILSTIHSAKGQEWKSVFVLNVVDGCIPSDMCTGSSNEIEEERRLLYVAMTRAKENLHLMVPHKFYVRQQTNLGDKHVYAGRSRFITKVMESKFESIAGQREIGGGSGKSSLGMANIQIRARAKNLWA